MLFIRRIKIKNVKAIFIIALISLLFSSGIAHGAGSVSGTISYSGTQTGTIYVAAFTSALTCSHSNTGNPYAYVKLSSVGAYTLSDLPG
jgi:hypothetical protein